MPKSAAGAAHFLLAPMETGNFDDGGNWLEAMERIEERLALFRAPRPPASRSQPRFRQPARGDNFVARNAAEGIEIRCSSNSIPVLRHRLPPTELMDGHGVGQRCRPQSKSGRKS